MSIERSAWKCPGCGKWHGPHVDSCPGPVDAIGFPMVPGFAHGDLRARPPSYGPAIAEARANPGLGATIADYVLKPAPDHKMVYASAHRPQHTSEPPRS